MPDILSVQPAQGMGNAPRPAPPPPPRPQVAPPSGGQNAGAAGHSTTPRDDEASARDARARMERRHYDEKVLTGPPPAFEASLLEVEASLDAVIRRMEAAREKARNAPAIAPRGQPAEAQPADAPAQGDPAAPDAATPDVAETMPETPAPRNGPTGA